MRRCGESVLILSSSDFILTTSGGKYGASTRQAQERTEPRSGNELARRTTTYSTSSPSSPKRSGQNPCR
jgi:hypothetical protein